VRDLEALEQRVAGAEQARREDIAKAQPAGAVRASPGGDRGVPQRPGIVWIQRLVALIVLIVWAIVVYKVLHGLV
jgi:hypothetical protein